MEFKDHYEIERLLYKYPEYADSGNIDAVGELFAHCRLPERAGGRVIGAKAFADMYRAIVRVYPDSGTPRTRHVVTNVSIEYDGSPERARARSYVVVFQGTDTVPLQPVIAGTYFDQFEKVEGTWRFAYRDEEMELVGNLSAHLLKAWPH